MTQARKPDEKAAAETKDISIDCAGALKSGEVIVGTPTVVASPAGELVITGIAVNEVVIVEPGATDVQVGQGILAFVGGGVVGTTYTLTFSYDTDGGQSGLEAVIVLKVK